MGSVGTDEFSGAGKLCSPHPDAPSTALSRGSVITKKGSLIKYNYLAETLFVQEGKIKAECFPLDYQISLQETGAP